MVTVKLLGGLGNQMFQYAVGRQLAIINNCQLTLDLSELLNHNSINYTARQFELDIFNINYARKIYPDTKPTFKDKFNRKFITRYVNETGHVFNPAVLKSRGLVYLNGFWQNEKYFKGVEDTIRKEFTFKTEPEKDLESNIVLISSVNSVSIHFRRGDYVSNQNANEFHGVVKEGYYKKAMETVKDSVVSPHFFIFSDDINWVKENFKIQEPHIFVSNSKNSIKNDMLLMSLCQHNIIANSSFSWWSAWLNQNKNKIVIAPEKWFNNIPTEIIPAEWIKI